MPPCKILENYDSTSCDNSTNGDQIPKTKDSIDGLRNNKQCCIGLKGKVNFII